VQAIKNTVTTELKIWEKLSILVGEGREAGLYQARVEDVINGGVVVTPPEFVSGHTLLRNDLPVVVQITREDAAYQFHSRIRVQSADRTRRIILTPPRGFQRVQRRMFARVDFPERVSYARLPADSKWEEWQKNGTWCETYAANISAGGILLKLVDEVKAGDLLALHVGTLAGVHLPADLITVCRRVFVDEGQKYAGFEFVLVGDLGRYLPRKDLMAMPEKYKRLNRQSQDRLVTYLFQKQIELRQKGLL
jgi:c-di-GMP-binding flagellar brake protein YcgR